MVWSLINTAPKDGTRILVKGGYYKSTYISKDMQDSINTWAANHPESPRLQQPLEEALPVGWDEVAGPAIVQWDEDSEGGFWLVAGYDYRYPIKYEGPTNWWSSAL